MIREAYLQKYNYTLSMLICFLIASLKPIFHYIKNVFAASRHRFELRTVIRMRLKKKTGECEAIDVARKSNILK